MKFYVMWTYIGNYSPLSEVYADSAEDAVKMETRFFSDDFHKKANIYVFDKPPVFQILNKSVK